MAMKLFLGSSLTLRKAVLGGREWHASVIQKAIWLLLAVIGAGRMSAVDIAFNQLDWLDNNGGFTSEKSDWGAVTVLVSSADTNLFTQTGNSFVGYVNIVTTVPGGNTNNWAVMNAPVVFNSLSEFDYGFPKSHWFNLGIPRGSIRVTSLNYRITIDAAPLATAPIGPMAAADVGISKILFGGSSGVLNGIAFSGNSGRLPPAPAFNFKGAAPGESAANMVRIGLTNISQVPVVTNENVNGCAPAAAARSIKYLARNNAGFTNSAQNIYDTIKGSNYMNSALGSSGDGTDSVGFKEGKDNYVATNKLGIKTVIGITNFVKVVNALSNGADVELHFIWYGSTNDAALDTNYFGHYAMVTSITTLVSNGVVSGYDVEWIDGEQGASNSSNRVHSYIFDTNGVVRTPDPGDYGTKLFSFYVETTNSPPSPDFEFEGSGAGGGKYLAPDGRASIVRFTFSGIVNQDVGGNFISSGPVTGNLSAFDFHTRTEVNSQSIPFVEGTSSGGGDFTVNWQSVATVDGLRVVVNFEASKSNGVFRVNIFEAEGGGVFVTGTGEEGRANMQLTITPIGSGIPMIKSVTKLPDGNMQIIALGIPDTSYLVQATTNTLNPSWATIGTATTSADGLVLFSDLHATNFPTRLYRLALP